LRVEVNEQDAATLPREERADIYGSGRFSDATFLICECVYCACHNDKLLAVVVRVLYNGARMRATPRKSAQKNITDVLYLSRQRIKIARDEGFGF
jgi:hypothetical protein